MQPSTHPDEEPAKAEHLEQAAACATGDNSSADLTTSIPTPPTIGRSTSHQRRPIPGILRLDIKKPRRSSGGSVDFRSAGEHTSSGVTSPHQLSVTWAPPCVNFDARQERRSKSMQNNADVRREHFQNKDSNGSTSNEDTLYESTNANQNLNFPTNGYYRTASTATTATTNLYYECPEVCDNTIKKNSNKYNLNYVAVDDDGDDNNDEQDDEEDYSVSVSAIIQRRASLSGYRGKRGSRKNSRRGSSPMDHVLDSVERRRSSVYTTSSEEGTNQESTQEQIFENIRIHKEVIQSVKFQPWLIRKKLKLVRQAKTYVARHEGALQERFAMSRSTRDLWARFKILMAARWRHWKREITSFLTVLIPWELRIKEIESHFGSGVASYFTFLRWLMWVNIMIAIPLVAFVIGPEYFATKPDESDPRKKMSEQENKIAGNLFTFWEFEGYLKYSPMFYGYYSSTSGISTSGYKLPLAYFLTSVLVYIYSFVATLRKMAENSRNSKLSSKDDECVFSWKLFTGWDFMIGHAETAHNRIASVVVGFKEALLEEAEKKKDNRNWRIILQRILVNILVMALLVASGFTVVSLVNKSEEWAKDDNWLSRNAVNVTMTLLSFFLPMIFEALGLFENWHPRQQLRLQLARIMILNMLNLYSLMFSFIYKINSKEKPLQALKRQNDSNTLELQELETSIEALSAITKTTLNYMSSVSDFSSTATIFGGDAAAATAEALISTTVATIYSAVRCYNVTFKCSKPQRITLSPRNITTTLLLLNLTRATMVPMMTVTLEPNTTTIARETTAITPTTAWTGTTTVPELTEIITTTTTKTPQVSTSTNATIPVVNTTAEYTTYEEYDYGSSDFSSISYTPTSTTTTTAPGNDSWFSYIDYFEGSPLINLDAHEEPQEKTDEAAEANDDDGTITDQFNISQLPKSENRKRRQVDSEESLIFTQQQMSTLRPSKYSKRIHNFTTTTSATTMATTTTTTTTSTTTAIPFTTVAGLPIYTKLSPEQIQKILAYFTTTTLEPPSMASATTSAETSSSSTTDASTSTTESTESTASSSTSTTDDYESTPYFIGYDEIAEIGRTIYYDADELNSNNFDYCIITLCDNSSSSTTESMDGATNGLEMTTMRPLTPLELKRKRLLEVRRSLKYIQGNLTNMCWETSLGQELSKVIVFDGIMSIVAPLFIDFLRALFVRYVNQNWCWDMEKTFPQYGDFKIAENILTLINNQGQVWMGIFFSPGLVLINLVKLVIMMYFRSWIVLTCNVPHEVVFKASKSNNFYLSLLLTMLFLCVLPVGYAIVWLRPSWHCGPFSEYNRISEFITNTTRNALPKQLHEPLDYLTSSSTVIPLLLLLILIIYYLVSLTGALREANQDLRTQLQKEREEERKKFFKVPEVKQAEPTTTTLTNRWRKVLEASSPVTPTTPLDFDSEEAKNQARKELISKIMKKALRKSSATSDEDSFVRPTRDDDDTDTEHQDSLPHDEEAKDKGFGLSRLQQIRRLRKPSLVDIVQIAKIERARVPVVTAAATTAPAVTTGIKELSKETQPRNWFKVEKLDKKDKNQKESKDAKEVKIPKSRTKEAETKTEESSRVDKVNEHDPDTNSRIVNERRASLLRQTREEDSTDIVTKEPDTEKVTTTKIPVKEPKLSQESSAPKVKSIFEIIDEKKSMTGLHESEIIDEKKTMTGLRESETKLKSKVLKEPQKPLPASPTEIGIGKFKFRRLRSKPATPSRSSNDTEIFKFDEKTVKKSKLGKPVGIPIVPSSESISYEHQAAPSMSDPSLSPTPQPSPVPPSPGLRQMNAEKLAQISRQGRKKIGSLLALVREAVNLIREDEQLADEASNASIPTTLTPASVLTTATPSTTIEIPATPEIEIPPPVFTCAISNAPVILPTEKTAAAGTFASSASTPVATAASTQASSTPVVPSINAPMSILTKPAIHKPPITVTTPKVPKPAIARPTTYTSTPTAPTPPPLTPSLAELDDLEELDQPGPITFPMRNPSQRRPISDHPITIRRDSQSSVWSDNIPTITISTTGSDENIIENGLDNPATENVESDERSTNPGPIVNIIKINIEDDDN